MNPHFVKLTGYHAEDWLVVVRYRDRFGVEQVKKIGVSPHTLTEEEAMQRALNSLGQSYRDPSVRNERGYPVLRRFVPIPLDMFARRMHRDEKQIGPRMKHEMAAAQPDVRRWLSGVN